MTADDEITTACEMCGAPIRFARRGLPGHPGWSVYEEVLEGDDNWDERPIE